MTQPDIALLDIEMPGGEGLTTAQALCKALPTCRCVILTTFGRSGYLRRAMDSGAVGFLLKDAPAAELAVALQRVMAGERVVDPDLVLSALSEGSNPLTPRERDVLSASLFGASLAEIAARQVLSEGTVRNHLSMSMQKLGAQNRMERRGWLSKRAGCERARSQERLSCRNLRNPRFSYSHVPVDGVQRFIDRSVFRTLMNLHSSKA